MKEVKNQQMPAYIYIVRCRDLTLYTGWTNDLKKRIASHLEGKGAKYTRGRIPVQLVYWEQLPNANSAKKRELEIKKLSRKQKEQLISTIQIETN